MCRRVRNFEMEACVKRQALDVKVNELQNVSIETAILEVINEEHERLVHATSFNARQRGQLTTTATHSVLHAAQITWSELISVESSRIADIYVEPSGALKQNSTVVNRALRYMEMA